MCGFNRGAYLVRDGRLFTRESSITVTEERQTEEEGRVAEGNAQGRGDAEGRRSR